MKKSKIVKQLAKSISLSQNPHYRTRFYDAETLLGIAIKEYGYETIRQFTVHELVEGIEENIPQELFNTGEIMILKEGL